MTTGEVTEKHYFEHKQEAARLRTTYIIEAVAVDSLIAASIFVAPWLMIPAGLLLLKGGVEAIKAGKHTEKAQNIIERQMKRMNV